MKLRLFTHDNVHQLNMWIHNEKQLFQFAGESFTFPITQEQITHYLDDDSRLAFVVIHNDSAIGHAEIYKENETTAKVCRILLNDQYRGQGLGKMLISLLLSHCFKQLACHTAYLHVYDWNEAAIHCYKQCSMSINPGMSSLTQFHHEQWTAIRMSITKEQWKLWKQDS